jgi:prepilin-type N-terminal cleavage/methylation domain-containing protein
MESTFSKTGNERGFSLVELIASLVIAGILAVALTTVVVTAMDGYVLSRDTADISQKAQLAMARMRMELLHVSSVSTATADKIAFSNADGSYEFERTGSTITLRRTSTPAVAPKALVDTILTNYGSDQLFAYRKKPGDGTWSTGENIDLLYTIDIMLKFDENPTVVQTSINPRANRLRVAPQLL